MKINEILSIEDVNNCCLFGLIHCGTVYNASKVLLNKDIDVINRFREMIKNDDSFMKELPAALKFGKPEVLDEIEGNLKSIETLFCLEDGNYWICARVESVNCYGDWYCISCKKCGKNWLKLTISFTVLNVPNLMDLDS
ncbi:hypothetical protein AAHA92_15433 [Salvia divinorum]|uniref:Uncharacterized protein n=1 Tax=Salvia divinorum TaxID=28513 RepID=A0ABD1HI07_SALDI